MTFTCTYRNAQGAQTTEVVEAASRQDVFAQLKARGIVPTRVTEGGRLSAKSAAEGGSAKGRRQAGALRGAIAGVLIVVAAIAVWFLVGPQTDAPVAKPAEPKPAKAKHAPQTRALPTTSAPAAKTAETEPAPETAKEPVRDESQPLSVVTNASGYIIETYLRDGKRTKVIKEPPPIFTNPADQVISWMMSAQPGQEIPPFPIDKSIEEDFKRSLTNNLAVLDTDDEKVAALKQSVLETRRELVKMLEKGYTVQEALTEHRRLVNENAKIRTDALLELQKIKADGDLEGAKKYVFKMNTAFRQMGIPLLPELRSDADAEPQRRGRAAPKPSSESDPAN